MPEETAIAPPETLADLLKRAERRLVRFLVQLWSAWRASVSAVWGRFQKLPARLRVGMASAAVLLIGGLVLSSAFSSSAKLNISCQHTFRSAEVSVWIDSDLVYSGTVSGSCKIPFGLFANRKPSGLAKMISVPSGRHSVRVRLNAEAEGYDQMKTVSAVFSDDHDNSLSIGAGRRGLYVSAQGGANVPAESRIPSSYAQYASSVFLSILASGMSAAIAFVVQEFMRSQKERLAMGDSATQLKS